MTRASVSLGGYVEEIPPRGGAHSHHYRGVALDWKAPDATPEQRAAQLATYEVFFERSGIAPAKSAARVMTAAGTYRLDLAPPSRGRVLWGGQSLVDRLRGLPRPLQVGGAEDREEARRARERAAYRRRLWELRQTHVHHVHIAIGEMARTADTIWAPPGGAA